ncbi:MAG: hypothetical protein ACOZF2_10880 [Thermodesulfobacteriota bacterium]
MGEPQIIIFEYKEITEALIKHQGIHEGLWSLVIRFGLQTANVNVKAEKEESKEILVPGVIIPLLSMGIQKHDKSNPFTVDAAEVNPLSEP